MKGKTYYTGTSYTHHSPPFASKPPSHRPWKDDSHTPVFPTQILYMWKTSLPGRWKDITARPMQHVKGLHQGKRDTLEFLRETQQYIDSIRKPMHGRGGEERTGSPWRRSCSPKEKPVGMQAGSREERRVLEEGKGQVGGLLSSRLSRTETLDSPLFSAREPPTTSETLQRVLTLPASLIEAGFGPAADPSPRDEYLIPSYVHPHSLVPLPKRPPKSRGLQRLCAAEVQSFLTRFERKREAEVAPVARKGMPGWKLKLGTKAARPRTEMVGNRAEMMLEGKQI